MRKITLFVTIVILICFVFSAANLAADKVVIKWGHVNHPGFAAYDAPLFFADKVKEYSNGEITCEVFPSGQLGGERDMIESIKLGTLQICHPNIALLTLNYAPIGLYQMPFLFKDFAHAKRVAESPIGQELNRQFEEASGMTMAIYFTEAPRGLFNDEGPIYEPEQMKGKKIRIMESELYRDMFGELGVRALPVPLPSTEVYTALATNLVYFGDYPIDHYITTKVYEVAKYYSLLDHVTGLKAVVVGTKWLKGLSEEHQAIIIKALKETEQFQNELSDAQQAEVIDWGTSNGVYVNLVNKGAFKEAMKPVYDKWIEKIGEEFATKFIETANELAN